MLDVLDERGDHREPAFSVFENQRSKAFGKHRKGQCSACLYNGEDCRLLIITTEHKERGQQALETTSDEPDDGDSQQDFSYEHQSCTFFSRFA